jgi:transposase
LCGAQNGGKEALQLFALFCSDVPIQYAVQFVQVSKVTASFWYKKFRGNALAAYNKEIQTMQLDGAVEVDESLFNKRKYNVGRLTNQVWVFGVCEETPGGKIFFQRVERRDQNTLLPIISRVVTPGSLVISDDWRAYVRLPQQGYAHGTVNHSQNFVNPTTGLNTQRIEAIWSSAKRWRRKHGYTRAEFLDDYLAEFCLRYNHSNDFGYLWETLL